MGDAKQLHTSISRSILRNRACTGADVNVHHASDGPDCFANALNIAPISNGHLPTPQQLVHAEVHACRSHEWQCCPSGSQRAPTRAAFRFLVKCAEGTRIIRTCIPFVHAQTFFKSKVKLPLNCVPECRNAQNTGTVCTGTKTTVVYKCASTEEAIKRRRRAACGIRHASLNARRW